MLFKLPSTKRQHALIEVNSAQEYRIARDAGFQPQQIHRFNRGGGVCIQ